MCQEKRKIIFPLALAVLAIYCRAALALGAGPQQYSADMLSRSGGQTVQSKVYVSGQKMRTEMSGNIAIIRMDKNVSWIIMPAERTYMEQPIDQRTLPKTSQEFTGEIERVSQGKEIVDGKPAEKFQVTYTEGGNRTSAYQWILDSGFPVKMQALDGSWSVEYKNVNLGPQPDTLFEVPAGYEKFAMPSAGAGGMSSLKDIMSQAEKYE